MGLEDFNDVGVIFGSGAARHGITPDRRTRSFHLPCATFDTITTARKGHRADRAWGGR
jgi:hypothetical protein